MRKKSKYKPRPAQIPCLVISEIVPEAQIVLFTAFQAFQNGWAQPSHFDVMLDTRDMLLLGSNAKEEEGALAVAKAANMALANIRDSWDGEKFYLSEDELATLKMLVDVSNDFWLRQSGNLYHCAYTALREWREKQEREKKDESSSNSTRSNQAGMVCGGVV